MFRTLILAILIFSVLLIVLFGWTFHAEKESWAIARSVCQFNRVAELVKDDYDDFLQTDYDSEFWFMRYDLLSVEGYCGAKFTYTDSLVIDSSGAEIIIKKIGRDVILIQRKKGPTRNFFAFEYNSVYIGYDTKSRNVVFSRVNIWNH